MILEDIEPELSIIGRDLRFISGSARAALRLRRRNVSLSAIARMFHWSRYRATKVCNKAQSDICLKLKAWIRKLPKDRQAEERSKRSGWVGHVETGLFPIQKGEHVLARFESIYPNLKSGWKR